MQTITIAKRQINYQHKLTLTYKLKITKTTYTNKENTTQYTKYKIRIPEELKTILKNQDKLYFNKIGNQIHITTRKKQTTIHVCKIQKNKHKQNTTYIFNLSKKVFKIKEEHHYIKWTVEIQNNNITDSTITLTWIKPTITISLNNNTTTRSDIKDATIGRFKKIYKKS